MADPRLLQRQQFDLIRCKLCNRLYQDPRILQCLHSFCLTCLETYVAQTTPPSQNSLTCPDCQEQTELSLTDGVKGLVINSLLIRLIDQAQKDKTSIVAGREVLKMSEEVLSEAELKCPEVVASIHEIASTAGHVLAGNIHDNNQDNDLDCHEVRQSIQQKTTQLQVKAMDIVHCIDNVNHKLHDWEERRLQIRDAIKHRSMEIQDCIRSIERRLISQLQDKSVDTKMKDEAFSVKNQLHKSLRTSLALVDFLRLVSEFGEGKELDKYSAMATSREERIYGKPVTLMENYYEFEHPNINIEESLEMMFGSLSETTEENVVWDPHKTIHQSNTEPDTDFQTDYFFTHNYLHNDPTLITQNYVEINENGHSTSVENNLHSTSDTSNRLARRQFTSTLKSGSHRQPMKSLSFDASSPTSPYHYITSENDKVIHDQVVQLEASSNKNGPEFQILNENEAHKTLPAKTKPDPKNNPVQSALNTLETSTSNMMQASGGQRSRRLSAPPSLLMESLNRRRLSALSILERANINTKGFNVTTDIESGINEARLEWLRENVRKKVERQNSQEEPV